MSIAQCWQSVDAGSNNALAIRNDGTLWSWGSNNYCKLGYTSPSSTLNPAMVNGNFIAVSTSDWHSAGIKTNGTLWTWGANYYGQGGQGTSGSTNAFICSPIQIGLDNNWQSVSVGTDYTLAIKTNGTLWATGLNSSGQLGTGDTTNRSFLTQIGTAANWKQVSANYGVSRGLKTDGTIWQWGYNTNTPTQLGTENDWYKLADTGGFMIKTNGTLWTFSGTPVQVGMDSDWLNVSNYNNHTLAIKTDHSLWAWGENSAGELGDGTLISQINPTQIGTETNWISVSTGKYFSVAIKSDGSLYSWGRNYDGRLGDGTTTDRHFPVQIICSSLNTENFTSKPINIYPNPNNGILFIENTSNINIEKLTLADLTGKLLLEIVNSFSEINMQSFENGGYILSVTSENKIYRYKIIKQ